MKRARRRSYKARSDSTRLKRVCVNCFHRCLLPPSLFSPRIHLSTVPPASASAPLAGMQPARWWHSFAVDLADGGWFVKSRNGVNYDSRYTRRCYALRGGGGRGGDIALSVQHRPRERSVLREHVHVHHFARTRRRVRGNNSNNKKKKKKRTKEKTNRRNMHMFVRVSNTESLSPGFIVLPQSASFQA